VSNQIDERIVWSDGDLEIVPPDGPVPNLGEPVVSEDLTDEQERVGQSAYYSFREDDGSFSGLVRVEEPGPVFSYADRERGEWVERVDLARHLVLGTIEFERVDDEQAAELAARYGVSL